MDTYFSHITSFIFRQEKQQISCRENLLLAECWPNINSKKSSPGCARWPSGQRPTPCTQHCARRSSACGGGTRLTWVAIFLGLCREPERIVKTKFNELAWLTLAWAWRPTPPMNLLMGTISLWAITFLRYLVARCRGMALMAWAVSLVFLKWTLR